MKPVKDYVLVVELKQENKTESGLILSSSVKQEGSNPGVVMAAGDKVEYVKVGDQVALEWSKGLPVVLKGEKAILISEEFIRAIY